MPSALKKYKLVVHPDDAQTGVFAVSLVDEPAIGVNWVAMRKHATVKLSVDKAKQQLTGPLLIPNQLIYRKDEELGEYEVYHDEASIAIASQKLLQHGLQSRSTHMHEVPLFGNSIIESWIIQDSQKDKAAALGFDLPKGTWMVTMKINDKAYWDEYVATGKVKGFSIEGFFEHLKINMTKQTNPKEAPEKKPTLSEAFRAQLVALGIVKQSDTPPAATEQTAAEPDKEKEQKQAAMPELFTEDGTSLPIAFDESGKAVVMDSEGNKYELTVVPVAPESPEQVDATENPSDITLAKQVAQSIADVIKPLAQSVETLQKEVAAIKGAKPAAKVVTQGKEDFAAPGKQAEKQAQPGIDSLLQIRKPATKN
jgi:hypothetical protein